MRMSVPRLNDEIADFEIMFQMWEQISQSYEHIVLDFSSCDFLRQNAVAFLGGLARIAANHSASVTFDWNTIQERVCMNLIQNGFLNNFERGMPSTGSGSSIPYQEHAAEDEDQIKHYLRNLWLGRGWVNVSAPLRDEIVSRVVEIYDNAFTHAQSPIGVTSCGQHYPYLKRLKLTIVDYGVGIPANVRRFLKAPELAPAEAIRWALQSGNTTYPRQTPRGLGLDLLKSFVKTNGGCLDLFSGGGYVRISAIGERYGTMRHTFSGTLVNITLQCDERFYFLKSEAFGGPLF